MINNKTTKNFLRKGILRIKAFAQKSVKNHSKNTFIYFILFFFKEQIKQIKNTTPGSLDELIKFLDKCIEIKDTSSMIHTKRYESSI